MKLLTVENLTLGYDSQVVAKDINFSLNQGAYLCIVGENGSGKSTLMRTLLTLAQPISGSIKWAEGFSANQIGYLPQQTQVQKDFPASVKEIVLSGYQGAKGLKPFYSKEEKEGAMENLRRMGMETMAGTCYRKLSGGQQQRVLLARALAATGKLLILDEPVSGLDPKASAELYELIKKLNDEGITVIMVSHDIDAAVKYASHILHMGHSVYFGTKEEYMNSEIGKSFVSAEEAEEVEGKFNDELSVAETYDKSDQAEKPAEEEVDA